MNHYRSLSHTAWDCKYHLIQKIKSLENAYSKGISMVLPLQSYRQKTMELSRSISYVELSVHREFTEHFIDNLDFPDTYLWQTC